MSEASEMIRRLFAQGDAVRDAGLVFPADVRRWKDISYGQRGEHPGWQLLDVMRPASAGERKLPVLLVFHGGGWVYGDKELYRFYAASMAQRGFAVVCFSYRLAPEYTFPASLEDAVAVMNWVMDHAPEYGLDTAHIFAAGDSAGGTLLCQAAALITSPDYARHFSLQVNPDFRFSGIALNCAAFVVDAGEEDPQTRALMADLFGDEATAEELSLMNVAPFITADFPPAFLMSGTGDFLSSNLPREAEALIAAGVPFTARFYKAEEPLGHVFHLNLRLAAGRQCNDEEAAFFLGLMD